MWLYIYFSINLLCTNRSFLNFKKCNKNLEPVNLFIAHFYNFI